MSLESSRDDAMQLLLRKSWTDAEFKRRLLADPAGVLREEGWEVPAGVQIVVVEETPTTRYLTLPTAPPVGDAELSATALNEIAGVDGAGEPPTYSIYMSKDCSREGCAAYPEQVVERSLGETVGPPTYSIYQSAPCSRQGCPDYPERVLERSRGEIARRRLETAARQ